MGVYLIPLLLKYEVILCLFLLESSVLIGPVGEPAEDMLVADGRLECLGLGKLRAFLAVGHLGGRYPTIRSIPHQQGQRRGTYHGLNWNRFGFIHLHCWISSNHSRPDSRWQINRSQNS